MNFEETTVSSACKIFNLAKIKNWDADHVVISKTAMTVHFIYVYTHTDRHIDTDGQTHGHRHTDTDRHTHTKHKTFTDIFFKKISEHHFLKQVMHRQKHNYYKMSHYVYLLMCCFNKMLTKEMSACELK